MEGSIIVNIQREETDGQLLFHYYCFQTNESINLRLKYFSDVYRYRLLKKRVSIFHYMELKIIKELPYNIIMY